MPFFDFIYNTFQERVNLEIIQGKVNPYYLPQVLGGIDDPTSPGNKLLPLKEADWNVGAITSTSGYTIAGVIASWYASYLVLNDHLPQSSTVCIASPTAPNPLLSLSQIEVVGLTNVTALAQPAITLLPTGYSVVISLEFNEIQLVPTLAINGNYSLTQAVCLSDGNSPPACGGYATTIQGTGTFVADFNSGATSTSDNHPMVDAQVALTVAGAGANRSLALAITGLTLRGQTTTLPAFTVSITSISQAPAGFLDTTWKSLANSAFGSTEAEAGIISSINQALNNSNNLQALSGELLAQLTTGLDNIFGAVPAAGLPTDGGAAGGNPVDLYLVDRLRAALNDSSSSYYLPTLLLQSKNPQLEPLSVPPIDLGSQTIGGLTWAPNTLTNVVITGLSNNVAPAAGIVLTEPTLAITTAQGTLTTPPAGVPLPPLTVTGSFSFTPPGGMQAITGSLTLTVSTSSLQILATASGTRIEELAISLTQLALVVPAGQLAISLTFEPDSSLEALANSLVQNASFQTDIIAKLNSQLADASLLTNISTQITNLVKNTVISRLGGAI